MEPSLQDQSLLPEIDPAHQQEIGAYLLALRSKDFHVRVDAVRRLGRLKAGPDVLLNALDDPSHSVRAEAAAALGSIRPEQVTPDLEDRLMAAIDDPSDRVCSAAIYSLGRLGIGSSTSQIEACLDDSNPYVLSAAILALARLGGRDLGDRLASYLDHEDIHPQIAAIRALVHLDYRPAGPKLISFVEANLHRDRQGKVGDLMASAVAALGVLQVREAIPLLIRLAQSQVGLRGRAVQALMALGVEEAAPVLAKMLAEPSGRLRESLVMMMIEADYRPALPLIRPLLEDQTGYLRDAALQAVRKMGDAAAARQVRWMCFHEPQPFTRLRALDCLVSLLGPGAIPDLIALKDDLNTEVRRAVAAHLGTWDALPPEALSALAVMAEKDPDPETAGLARQALSARPPLADLPLPAEPLAPARRLPQAVADLAPSLLPALQAWQAGLPELARGQSAALRAALSAEEIAETDRALAHLIRVLEGEIGE
jgi:HEAT repeat protein